MIQPINNSNIVSSSLSPSTNSPDIKTSNTAIKRADAFIKDELSSVPDTYSPEIQQSISPDDVKYLGIADFPDGNTINFPPDNASLATKKAWIESMKKMTPEEQFMAKTQIFIYAQTQHLSNNPSQSFSSSEAKNILSQITSYQDLFKGFISQENKQSGSDQNTLQHTVQIDNTILDTFMRYNIK